MGDKIKLENFQWHDAELLKISIDRSDAGSSDEIELLIKCVDDITSKIIFKDCRKVVCDMNMGVIANETILDASYDDNNSIFLDTIATWKGLDVKIEDWFCFVIETNSTASSIIVIASGVEIQ